MSRNRELFHSDMPEKQPPELQIEVQIEQKVTQRIPLDIQREAASPQRYHGATRRTKESRAGALWRASLEAPNRFLGDMGSQSSLEMKPPPPSEEAFLGERKLSSRLDGNPPELIQEGP